MHDLTSHLIRDHIACHTSCLERAAADETATPEARARVEAEREVWQAARNETERPGTIRNASDTRTETTR